MLIGLGFRATGNERQLQCIECNQRATLDPELSVAGMVPLTNGKEDCPIKVKIERFVWRLRTSTHEHSCRFRQIAQNQTTVQPDFCLQSEFNLQHAISIQNGFCLRNKKLLILRGKEIVETLEQSMASAVDLEKIYIDSAK